MKGEEWRERGLLLVDGLDGIEAGGEPLPETVMVSSVAGAQNVATMTTVRNFCEGYDRISVANTGAAAATVENAKLFVKRIA